MRDHEVRVQRPGERFPRTRELAWRLAEVATDFAHPGDNIPPLLAVAQQCCRSGADLVRAVATAYEVQVALTTGIDLHSHRIDHVAHLGPSVAAGLGALLGLPVGVIYQAINQALHVTTTTRQPRKGTISSWKAFAPAHAGKLAVEAVDRAMRGQGAPAPIWEGTDGVAAWLQDGPDAVYRVPLPEPGEPRRAILDTFTKAHSAEYQAQAFIDLAFRLRERVGDTGRVKQVVLRTSDHTHHVIGTGASDPEKLDPAATRETLDHSVMYIFAVALQDGRRRHVDSSTPERAARPDTVRLWHRVKTVEDPAWTARYHDSDPARRAFGGRAEVHLAGGEVVAAELADLGVNLVIYPVTGLRLAMGAVEDGLRRLRDDGTQAGLLDRMQTRARLHDLVGYGDYAAFDQKVDDVEKGS